MQKPDFYCPEPQTNR